MGPGIPCFCGGYPRHFCRHNDWARHPKYVAALGPRRTTTAGAHKSGERKPPGEQQTRRTNKTANKQVPPQPNTTNKTANKTTNKPANNKTANKTTNTANNKHGSHKQLDPKHKPSQGGSKDKAAFNFRCSPTSCPYSCPYLPIYGQLCPYSCPYICPYFEKPYKTNEKQWFLIWAKLPI